MKNKKEKIIGSAIIFCIFLSFFIINYMNNKPNREMDSKDIFVEAPSYKKEEGEKPSGKNKKLMVEIKGEVKKPDVYIMDEGSIVKDIIIESGGLKENADMSRVNQAQRLRDGDCIVIPSASLEGDNSTATGVNAPNVSSSNSNGIININRASKEELMKLPGVGEVTAQKIIDYREKNGGFNSVEDLKNIDRIGDKTLSKFKDKIDIR